MQIPSFTLLRSALIVAVSALFLLGCSKATNSEPSKSELLVKTSWAVRSTIPFVDEVTNTVFQFVKDGSYQQISPDGTIAALGKWGLANGETAILVTLSSTTTLTFDLLELTDKTLRFRLKIPNNGIIVEFYCVPVG